MSKANKVKVEEKKWQESKATVTSTILRLMTILPPGESFWVDCYRDAPSNFQNEWNRKNANSKLKITTRKKLLTDTVSLEQKYVIQVTIVSRND